MEKERIVGKDTGYIGGIAKKMICNVIDTVSGFQVALTIIDSTFSYGRYAIKFNAKAIIEGGWETKRMGPLNIKLDAFYKAVKRLQGLGVIGMATTKKQKYIFVDVKNLTASALKEMIMEGANNTDYYKVMNNAYTKICKDYNELGICSELSYREDEMKIKDIKGVIPEKTVKRREKQDSKVVETYTVTSLLRLIGEACESCALRVYPVLSWDEKERVKEEALLKAVIRLVPPEDMKPFITATVKNWELVYYFLRATEIFDAMYLDFPIPQFCFYREQIYNYYKGGFPDNYRFLPSRIDLEEQDEFLHGKKVISLAKRNPTK